MQKRKFHKPLLLAGLLCVMPVVAIVAGCGGGNDGPSVPAITFVGNYTGTYRVTQGPSTGETGTVTLRVNNDGSVSGSVTDASGDTANLSGTANTTSGAFSVTGIFEATGTTVRATGTLTSNNSSVTGTGTFELSNGNRGTFTLSKS